MSQRSLIPTLAEARKEFHSRLEEGMQCRVCDRWGRIYMRKFNSTMARSLIWMVRNFKEEWLDIANTAPRFIVKSNQHTTMRHWGLVERGPNDDPSKKHGGLWRPTPAGIQFAHGETGIPDAVSTYNDTVFGFSEKIVSIRDVVGSHFNYEELMRQ